MTGNQWHKEVEKEVEKDVRTVACANSFGTARKGRMTTGENVAVTKLELSGPTLYYRVSSTEALRG